MQFTIVSIAGMTFIKKNNRNDMDNQNTIPKTLIQIHYHDKPCGVMQVIRYYAKAFKTIDRRKDCCNILICEKSGEEKYPEFPDKSILSFPQAGYEEFKNRKEFLDRRKIIIEKITSLLLSNKIKTPVAIVAHNLTLCKNAALVSAFAELARCFASPKNNYRFFSVVHDFAQEGRVGQLMEINRLEKSGIPIMGDIAAAGAPIHFLTVHPRAKKTLDGAGFHVSLLVNPVQVEMNSGKEGKNLKKLFVKSLEDYSKNNGRAFKADRPVFVYPVRTIARKNPFEAIAIACIATEANLLLGGAGSSIADKKRHAEITRMAKEHQLPVVTDIIDIITQSKSLQKFAWNNPIPLLYTVADKVISCAFLEGFGYLLHEPWLYDRPVFGRRPKGFNAGSKMSGKNYYDFLPIPAEWIDKKNIKRKYQAVTAICLADKKQKEKFVLEVDKSLSRNFIDFAFLDEKSQISVIEKLLSSKKRRTSWRALLEKPMPGWPGSSVFKESKRSFIQKNKNRIEKQFSMKNFAGQFTRCMRIIPEVKHDDVNWRIIEKEYGDAIGFRMS